MIIFYLHKGGRGEAALVWWSDFLIAKSILIPHFHSH